MKFYQKINQAFNLPIVLNFAVFLLIAGAVWAVYYICMGAKFQLDDGVWIVQNPIIHMLKFDLKTWIADAFKAHPARWFAMMTFSLNYYFAMLDPFWYRVVNVVIHIFTAFILFRILMHTLEISMEDPEEKTTQIRMIALITALIWALHPAQTSAVTYIIQRMASMSVMLMLASIYLYIIGRETMGTKRISAWLGCGICIVLGVSTKQIALITPVVIAAYEFYFYRGLRFSADENRHKLITRTAFALFFITSVFVAWKGNLIVDAVGYGDYGRYDFDMHQRLLSQPRIIFYYLSLIFWPHYSRICTDPSFIEYSPSLFEPWTNIPAFMGVAVLVYLIYFFRRRSKILSFCLLGFFLGLVIEQTIVPLQLVFHHRLYFPSIFIIFGCVYLVGRWVSKINLVTPMLVCVTVIICLLGFSTTLRNEMWNSAYRLWEAELELDPNSTRIMINLSKEYLNAGAPLKALPILYRAIEINPDLPAAHLNIGSAYRMLGQYEKSNYHLKQSVKKVKLWSKDLAALLYSSLAMNYQLLEDYDEAEKMYNYALGYVQEGEKAAYYYKLSHLYYNRGDGEKAIEYAEKAVEKNPKFSEAHFFLGSLYALPGADPAKAKQAFLKSLGSNSATNLKVYKHLASLAEHQEDWDEAMRMYEKVFQIRPKDANSLLSVGTIYARKGNVEKAEEYYEKCIATRNLQILYKAYFNLGRIQIQKGDIQKGFELLMNSYNLNSGFAPTLYMLGNIYFDAKKYAKTKEVFEKLLELEPEHPQAEFVKKRLAIAKEHVPDEPEKEKG